MVQHHFLLYIGDKALNEDKGANMYADTYNPSELSVTQGTLFGERSWQDELRLQLSMDEGTGTSLTDLSFQGNVSTFNGTPTYTAGKTGTGLDFSGSADYITIPDNGAHEANNAGTYMIWVKYPSGWASSGSNANFINKGSGWSFDRVTNADKFEFTAGGVTLAGDSTAAADSWHHLAATISGGTVTFFIDGVVVDRATGVTPAANADGIRIGSETTAATYFAGQLDDVRIYRPVLDASEIQAIYNLGFSGKSGTYKTRANNNNRLVLTMNTQDAHTRFQPAFEIDNWYGGAVPRYVYVDGVQMRPFIDFISVLEPKIVGVINMGNKLEIQFNKTFTQKNVDIFIDNDDSTGFMGSSSLMPTLTMTTSGTDLKIQNFSGSLFGDPDANQWELIIDKQASTGTTDGDGGIYSWKTSANDPSIAVADAIDILSDSSTLDMLVLDESASSGGHVVANASITTSIKDSSSVRLKVEMEALTVNVSDPDFIDTRTYTIYPTGRVYIHHKITSLSASVTDVRLRFEGLNGIAGSSDAWNTTIVGDSARAGRLSPSDTSRFHSFGVGILGLEESGGTDVPQIDVVDGLVTSSTKMSLDLASAYFQSGDPTFELTYVVDIAEDYSDAGELEARLRDVQNPGSVTNIVGALKTDDVMDNDGDGFAEGEGAYTHSATGGIAHFTLGMQVTRYNPVFKIYSWTTNAVPAIVLVNNQEKIRGYQYNAYVDGSANVLIVAFNDTWKAPNDSASGGARNIFISLKAGLAVTMNDSDFVAISAVGVDSLKWTTHSEMRNLGFKIKRRIKPGQKAGQKDVVPTDTLYKFITRKLIPGAPGGRSSSDRDYIFVDRTARFGIIYEYMLIAYDERGFAQEFGPREASPLTPLVTRLYGNYPNPFTFWTIRISTESLIGRVAPTPANTRS